MRAIDEMIDKVAEELVCKMYDNGSYKATALHDDDCDDGRICACWQEDAQILEDDRGEVIDEHVCVTLKVSANYGRSHRTLENAIKTAIYKIMKEKAA